LRIKSSLSLVTNVRAIICYFNKKKKKKKKITTKLPFLSFFFYLYFLFCVYGRYFSLVYHLVPFFFSFSMYIVVCLSKKMFSFVCKFWYIETRNNKKKNSAVKLSAQKITQIFWLSKLTQLLGNSFGVAKEYWVYDCFILDKVFFLLNGSIKVSW
jgi:hypothetical protein